MLHVPRSSKSPLSDYAFDMAQHPTIQQSHYEQLTPRDQYLLKHKGQAYVECSMQVQEQLQYRRSPEYLAEDFCAIYAMRPNKSLLKNLAAQNIQPAIQDKSLLMLNPKKSQLVLYFGKIIFKQYPQSSLLK